MTTSDAHAAGAALRHTLRAPDISGTILCIGDSTADEIGEWWYRFAARIADEVGSDTGPYMDRAVEWHPWDPASQSMDGGHIIRDPGGGPRMATFSGTGQLTTSGDPVTADLQVVVSLSLDDWTPTGAGTQTIVARYDGTGDQRSWRLSLLDAGVLRLTWSADGTSGTLRTLDAPASTGFTSGWGWIRVDFTEDDSGDSTAAFYTAPWTSAIKPTSGWSQIGATQTTTTQAIHPGTAPYSLGAWGTLAERLTGSIGRVYVRDGADGADMVPVLPEMWEPVNGDLSAALFSGDPAILIFNASEGGRDLDYWYDASRRDVIVGPQGYSMVVVNTAHNDAGNGPNFLSSYSNFVDHVQARSPYSPIVLTSQNLTLPGSGPTPQRHIQARHRRLQAAMRLASAKTGVWPLDIAAGFDRYDSPVYAGEENAYVGQIDPDGTHPSPSGSYLQTAAAWEQLGL